MRKLLLAILVIAVAMPAFASETRLRTLGPGVAPFIEDDANVFMWYATLPSYEDLVTVTVGYYDVYYEMEDYDDFDEGGEDLVARFGLTYGLGDDAEYGVLGLWWEEDTPGPNRWMGSDGLWAGPMFGPYTDFSDFVYNKWHAMYGYQMDGMSFGLYFNRADQGAYEEQSGVSGEFEDYSSYTTIGAGVRFDVGDDAYADLAFDWTTVSFTYTELGDDEEVEADANMVLGFRGRMFYEWTDMITWVPYVSYRMGDLSLKSTEEDFYADGECWGIKGFQFDLGLAANMMVNDETMIIVAVEPFGYYKAEPSDCGPDADTGEVKMTMLPAFAFGFENDVKEWLTLRLGCDKVFVKYEESFEAEGETGDFKMTMAPFNWYLGLGFHVSDFDIDVMVNKEVPFSMGYWLTGFRPAGGYDAGAPIGMISATYHF